MSEGNAVVSFYARETVILDNISKFEIAEGFAIFTEVTGIVYAYNSDAVLEVIFSPPPTAPTEPQSDPKGNLHAFR